MQCVSAKLPEHLDPDLDHKVGVLQCVAECCSVMQCIAVSCSVMQCDVVCCSVLQCVAVCCSVLMPECCNI